MSETKMIDIMEINVYHISNLMNKHDEKKYLSYTYQTQTSCRIAV